MIPRRGAVGKRILGRINRPIGHYPTERAQGADWRNSVTTANVAAIPGLRYFP